MVRVQKPCVVVRPSDMVKSIKEVAEHYGLDQQRRYHHEQHVCQLADKQV